jgi:hypothetical protein
MNEPADREPSGSDTSRAYRLWHVGSGNEFIAIVAEAGSFEEIIRVRRRPDWRSRSPVTESPSTIGASRSSRSPVRTSRRRNNRPVFAPKTFQDA